MALIEICNIFYLLLLHSLAPSPSLEENPFSPGFHSQKDEASGSREVVFESTLTGWTSIIRRRLLGVHKGTLLLLGTSSWVESKTKWNKIIPAGRVHLEASSASFSNFIWSKFDPFSIHAVYNMLCNKQLLNSSSSGTYSHTHIYIYILKICRIMTGCEQGLT